ncbi:hypothetical protein BDF22DRAFT_94859 [Syncephalis plumigaleata]|nr:hypothetical protein BDF22DRAFT_94859 [Syncephalis plumigaleata]
MVIPFSLYSFTFLCSCIPCIIYSFTSLSPRVLPFLLCSLLIHFIHSSHSSHCFPPSLYSVLLVPPSHRLGVEWLSF